MALTNEQNCTRGVSIETRSRRKGCLLHKRGCEVRQSIYEQVGFDLRKTLQNTRGIKTRGATSWCKMKIDMHEVTQRVAVTKYRVPNRLEHLRGSNDQRDAKLVKYEVTDKIEPPI